MHKMSNLEVVGGKKNSKETKNGNYETTESTGLTKLDSWRIDSCCCCCWLHLLDTTPSISSTTSQHIWDVEEGETQSFISYIKHSCQPESQKSYELVLRETWDPSVLPNACLVFLIKWLLTVYVVLSLT